MPIINMIPAKSSMVLAAGTESIIVRKGIILYRNSWVPSDASSLYEYRIDDEKITEYNNRKNNNTNSNSNQSEISTMLSDFDFDYEKKDKPEKSI